MTRNKWRSIYIEKPKRKAKKQPAKVPKLPKKVTVQRKPSIEKPQPKKRSKPSIEKPLERDD